MVNYFYKIENNELVNEMNKGFGGVYSLTHYQCASNFDHHVD